MFVSNNPWREPALMALCAFQALLSFLAAAEANKDVDSILGTCPGMAVLGFVLAFVAVRRASLSFLVFGLWCPLVTSTIALVIASFGWSFGEATTPVFVMLALNSAITAAWVLLAAVKFQRVTPSAPPAAKPRIRFRVKDLLRTTALLAVLLTLLNYLSYSEESIIFWLFGIGVLTISLAIGVGFFYRTRAG